MDLDENKDILAVHVHHTLKTYPCCNLHNTQEVRTWHATPMEMLTHTKTNTHTQTDAQTGKRYTHR